MYLDYWQLDGKPFESICETQSDYLSNAQCAAVRKLRYVVESRRSAALLAGPAGIGKTMVVETLQRELGNSFGPFVHIVFPQMPQRDLLAYLAERLGAPQVAAPQRTVDESLRRMETLFAGVTEDTPHAVIVVDEAHLLEDGVLLEPLRLLLNLRAKSHPAFTLILCGQLELPSIVNRYGALEERIDVKVLLSAFSPEETAAYIANRLQVAGATREIFTPDAVETAHQLTGGIARRINRLCDLALLVGFASGQSAIDGSQLRSVNEELIEVSRVAA